MNTFDKYRVDRRALVLEDLLSKHGPVVIDELSFDCKVDVEFRRGGASEAMEVHWFEMGDVYIVTRNCSYLVDQAHFKTANKLILEQLTEEIRRLAFEVAQRAYSFQWESLDESE